MKIGNSDRQSLPLIVGTISSDRSYPAEHISLVDFIEIRVDMLDEGISDVASFFRMIIDKYGKPVIATIRSKAEGGAREMDDEQRYGIFTEVVTLAEIIDVELSSSDLAERVLNLCRQHDRRLMVSYHNFEETPPEDFLGDIVERGKSLGADIVKIAVSANSKDDLGNLIRFTVNNRDKGLVTISMGSTGLASRLVTPLIGSLMTYGYIDSIASPGQLHVSDLVKYLRMLDPEYDAAMRKRGISK
jgi:3-dehydroquinate dehydratase-1